MENIVKTIQLQLKVMLTMFNKYKLHRLRLVLLYNTKKQ